MNQIPPVTIGLPVYNGEEYLGQAIESILSQDFSDFVLIISDNASTDATWSICCDYCRRDPRIRLHRVEVNRGANHNFRLLFEMSASKYFMWFAADDLMASDYVGRCYRFLETNPEYVVCFSNVTLIDNTGRELFSRTFDLELDSDDINRRFEKYLANSTMPMPIYGLLRTLPLREGGIQLPDTFGSDRVFVAALSLIGKFHQIRTPLIYRRFGERWHFLPDEAPGHPALENQYRGYTDNCRAIFDSRRPRPWFPLVATYWALCEAVCGKSAARTNRLRLFMTMSKRFSPIEAAYWDLMMLLYPNEGLRPFLWRIHCSFRKVSQFFRD